MNQNKPTKHATAWLKEGLTLTAAILVVGLGIASPAHADDVEFVLDSAIRVDPPNETITLPVFQGVANRDTVYYIVTESSDKDDAGRRKVNYAPKLKNALGTAAVRRVGVVNGVVHFQGSVAFASTRPLRPGPDGIPPGTFPPGSVADANYSPLITTGNGIVLNASHVKNSRGEHDSLVSIDLSRRPTHVAGAVGEVTLSTFAGFYNGEPILYLHMEGSRELVAMVEGSTFAPNLNFAPGLASNERETSARSAIIPFDNGLMGRGNPERQGLNSFMANEGDPLNVTQTFPGKGGRRYSPIWDIHIVHWTDQAIAAGERRRLESVSEIIGEFRKGNLVSAGTGPANSSLKGIRAFDAVSNCPIVVTLPSVERGARGAPQSNSW
ncbi:MAG: hypothetical protein ABIQ03_09680 [Burkholderiales bacterium]